MARQALSAAHGVPHRPIPLDTGRGGGRGVARGHVGRGENLAQADDAEGGVLMTPADQLPPRAMAAARHMQHIHALSAIMPA